MGASLALAASASAQTFKVTGAGTITYVQDQTVGFDTSVNVGTPFTFSFLFDYSVPAVTNAGGVAYFASGANLGATANIGDYTFAPDSASTHQVEIIYFGGNNDRLDLSSSDVAVTNISVPYGSTGIAAELPNLTGLFSSGALPPVSTYSALDLSNSYFYAIVGTPDGGGDYNNNGFYGTFTSLSAELVNPVPEASTNVSFGLLLALGLGGVVIAARRRKA